MVHLASSSSDTLLCCDSKILESWYKMPRLMSPHPHTPARGHGKASFLSGPSYPLLATSPNLPNLSCTGVVGFQDPTLRDFTPVPASLPARGVRDPLLAAKLLIILLPLSLHSAQLPPEHPLAGDRTRYPLRPGPPPRPSVAVSAHRASSIWPPALTSHWCLVRHPSSPGHILEGRDTDGGLQAGACGEDGGRSLPRKEEK